jgi:hypothetical protein
MPFIQTAAQQSFQSNSKLYVLALSSCIFFLRALARLMNVDAPASFWVVIHSM